MPSEGTSKPGLLGNFTPRRHLFGKSLNLVLDEVCSKIRQGETMRILKIALFLFFAAWLVLPLVRIGVATGQTGSIDSDPPPGSLPACISGAGGLPEAKTGFDDQSINQDF